MKKAQYLLLLFTVILFSCNTSNGIYENVRGKHLIIKNGEKQLFWFSGIHSNDPSSVMFEDIKREINVYKPSYILVEGGFDKNEYETEEKAKLDGESAYTSFLAKELNIPVDSIEPTDEEINAYLLLNYSSEEIFSMYIIRQMRQKQRESNHKGINFDNLIDEVIRSGATNGLPDIEESKLTSANLIDPYVGYHVDQNNWLEVDTYSIIHEESGKLYKVWKATIDYRNQHIIKLLPILYETYDRIFIMMGFDHARDLSSELEELVNNLQ